MITEFWLSWLDLFLFSELFFFHQNFLSKRQQQQNAVKLFFHLHISNKHKFHEPSISLVIFLIFLKHFDNSIRRIQNMWGFILLIKSKKMNNISRVLLLAVSLPGSQFSSYISWCSTSLFISLIGHLFSIPVLIIL